MKRVQVGHYNFPEKDTEQIDPSLVNATGQPQPTARVLDGSDDHGFAEEWQEPAVMPDGRKCYRIYLFNEDEIKDDDGELLEADEYPFDHEHVQRIVLNEDE
jgi:hypothetical protein